MCAHKTRVELQKLTASFSRGFRRPTELGGVFTRVAVVFSPHVELVVKNLRRRLQARPHMAALGGNRLASGSSDKLNTKRALRDSEDRIVAMETKIDNLTKMLQTLIEKNK